MKNRNLDHSNDWATPDYFYDELDEEFHFDFDPCPLFCPFDGLKRKWGKSNFINPPYNRLKKEAFVEKALEESLAGNTCVLLLPVSTSTKLFHEVIKPHFKEIRFIRGRLPFAGINRNNQCVNWKFSKRIWEIGDDGREHIRNAGQHDSMVVVFKAV